MPDSSSITKSGEGEAKDASMELNQVDTIVLDVASSFIAEPENVVYRLYKRRFVGLVGLVRSTI